MSKESGIFLQTRKEGLLRLITFACSSTPDPAALEEAFGRVGWGEWGEDQLLVSGPQFLVEATKDQSVGLFFSGVQDLFLEKRI